MSLMNVAQNLLFITSYYTYFNLLMILFQFNDAYLKWHSFVKPCYLKFMIKYYITVLFRQFTETLNHFFTYLV